MRPDCAQRRPRTSSSANPRACGCCDRARPSLNEGRGRRPRRTRDRPHHPRPERARSTKAEDVVLGERDLLIWVATHVNTLNEGRGRRPRRTGQGRGGVRKAWAHAQRRPRTSSSANRAAHRAHRRTSVAAQRRPRTSSSANLQRTRHRSSGRRALNEGRGRRPRRTRRGGASRVGSA